MARYEHLPIYLKAMELSVYLDTVVRNFSRYHKYSTAFKRRPISVFMDTGAFSAKTIEGIQNFPV